MATPTILINQSGLPAGTAGQSRSDLVVGQLVTLTDPANPGADSYQWTLISRPIGSTSNLSGASTATCTFTPDLEGTYLVKLLVNNIYLSGSVNVIGDFVSTQGGCGVKNRFGFRVPSATENQQFSSVSGWADSVGGILISASNRLVPSPMDYGAKFDGTTDDTNAIQECINNSATFGMYWPPGDTIITDTLNFLALTGIRITGQGIDKTNIIWRGANNRPAFNFDQCQDCLLTDIKITAETSLIEAIRITDTRTNGSQRSSRVRLQDVFIQCANLCAIGINIKLGSAIDAKNDHHTFFRIQIQEYTDVGISIEGQAARNIIMVDPILQGRTGGQYGITTARVPGHGGSCFVFGGTIMENQITDLEIGDRSGPCRFDSIWFEQSARMLIKRDHFYADSAQVEKHPITITSCRWSGNSAIFPADKEVIQSYDSGPLIIEGCQFGLNDPTLSMRFRVEPRYPRSSFIFRGNALSTLNEYGHFTGTSPDDITGTYVTVGTLKTDQKPILPYYDGNTYLPTTPEDWTRRGVPIPRSWWNFQENTLFDSWLPNTAYEAGDKVTNNNRQYLCVDNGISAASGGPTTTENSIIDNTVEWDYIGEGQGIIYDLNVREDRKNLYIRAGATLQQTTTTFSGYAGGLTETADQQFYLNDSDGYFNPNVQSQAVWGRFVLTSVSAADRCLYIMGNGTNGANGGPMVRFTAGGLMKLMINSNTYTGVYDYRDGNHHDFILVYDRTNQLVNVYTEREQITGVYHGTVGNLTNKGYGSSAGSLSSINGYMRAGAVWRGPVAETLVSGTISKLRAAI